MSIKNYMIKNNYRRVLDLHSVHLIVKLVHGVPHVRSKVDEEIMWNINCLKYPYRPKENILLS